LLTIISTLLVYVHAKPVVWDNGKTTHTIINPFFEIGQLIEKKMYKDIYDIPHVDFVNLNIPKVQEPIVPEEVIKPALPPSSVYIKGEFEKTSAFELRVEKAKFVRDKKLKKLQSTYRKSVEKRNLEIERISYEYNQKVAKRNALVKKFQDVQKFEEDKLKSYFKNKKINAHINIAYYAKPAISKVYGKPKLEYEAYNADDELMHLKVTSSDMNNFSKDIAISIAPKYAKELKSNISNITPSVKFNITIDDNGLQMNIQQITISFMTKNYYAQDVKNEITQKPMVITLKTSSDIQTLQNHNLKLQENSEFKLQNPNLNDKFFKISNVAYNKDGAIVGANALLNKVNKLEPSKIDSSKWLFMIAIENYDETDPVQYSIRSAYAIERAMQVRFGIDTQHTISLIDNKATSGSIRDNFEKLLSMVEPNDIIYFYYSGHGLPGKNGDAYILPKDKIVDFIDKDPFFRLENIYHKLSFSDVKHSFVFVDACFSGRTDNKLLFKGVAPGLTAAKKTLYDQEKMTIITAGKNNEFSNAYQKQKYRLFSYYLTKAFINNQSDLDLLYKQVSFNVLKNSKAIGDRYIQTPQVYGNTKVKLF
jgi:hypothetical protein